MLAVDKFIAEFHLREPIFTCTTCVLFTYHCKMIQTFKEIGDLNYIYKNELDKDYFFHDVVFADSKYLTNRTVRGKVLKVKLRRLN